MEFNENIPLPDDFILDITGIAGSSSDVCLIAIEHYSQYITSANPVVKQIATAMVGNLTEYYNISHPGSPNFEQALPHLSEMANFMDSKNTPQMDVESTARIKSFYSTYEKLLLECSESLEKDSDIPDSKLAYDLIATRDILYPRYQLRLEPHNFYRHVYSFILDYMEHIDELSKTDSRYGFEALPTSKRIDICRPKKFNFVPDASYTIPDKDFTGFAYEIKEIPPIYRHLVALLDEGMSPVDIKAGVEAIQNCTEVSELENLEIYQAMQNALSKQNLFEFRDTLEKEVLDYMPIDSKMVKDYRALSTEDFLYVYKQRLTPPHRDFIRVVDYIDSVIEKGNYDFYLNFSEIIKEGPTSEMIIHDLLSSTLSKQKTTLLQRIKLAASTDLDSFDETFEEASRIERFAQCSKDYMRNPKSTGYQSFHVIVQTPFGRYEKQIRTSAQNDFAEHGHASHSATYKPYEKENFHRLKIFQPLMPARDEKGNIITPIRLAPLDFPSSVRAYYHQPFAFFSGGLTFKEFQAEHPDDFDDAMLALSEKNISEGLLDRIRNSFSFLRNFEFFKPFSSRRSVNSNKDLEDLLYDTIKASDESFIDTKNDSTSNKGKSENEDFTQGR